MSTHDMLKYLEKKIIKKKLKGKINIGKVILCSALQILAVTKVGVMAMHVSMWHHSLGLERGNQQSGSHDEHYVWMSKWKWKVSVL